MRRAVAVVACGALLAGLWPWHPSTSAEPPAATAPAGLIVRGSVRLIRLPEGEPQLPPGAGREATQLFCGTCHTTQYIMIQPPFSRQTWLAEVTKMRQAYSAPIPEEKVGEIVDYLNAVRGIGPK